MKRTFRTWLSDRINHLLTSPREELGSWARLLRYQWRFWTYAARRLRENNVLTMSAALSYRTIFALVPALILGLLLLETFGLVRSPEQSANMLLESMGIADIQIVHDQESPLAGLDGDPEGGAHDSPRGPSSRPATGTKNLAEILSKLIAKVDRQLSLGRVGPVGVVLLVWAALMLLTTVEKSLNKIFKARRSRSLRRRIPLYWSIMTLGPLVLVAAHYVAVKMIDYCRDLPVLNYIIAVLGWAGPVAVGIVLLAFLYMLLPNTRVSFTAAAGAAAVAVLSWVVMEWAFGMYVRELVGRGNLYGALGLIPLFLIYVNFSWVVFLFGAQLAEASRRMRREARKQASPGEQPAK